MESTSGHPHGSPCDPIAGGDEDKTKGWKTPGEGTAEMTMATTLPDPYANSSAPDPIYIGDCTWKEMDGATIEKNEFEIDVLERPFMGPKSAFDAWIKNFPKYSADYQYKTMARTIYNTRGLVGGMMECKIQYKGLIDGTPPTLQPVTDVAIKAVQLTTDVEADGIIEVQYYAPITIYRYVKVTQDGGPAFTSVLPTDMPITPFEPRPPKYAGNLQFQLNEVVESFKREQHGLWFAYEVQVAKLLQPKFELVEISVD